MEGRLFYTTLKYIVGQDSAVGIASRYGLDGPGIESLWWATFSAPVQTGPGAHPASCTMGTGSVPRVKQPGRGVDHPPPSSAEVKERVQLYLSGPSWPVLGRPLPLLSYDADSRPERVQRLRRADVQSRNENNVQWNLMFSIPKC